MKNLEIELKFKLEKADDAINILNSKACSIGRDEYQKDTYYIPAHRNFLKAEPISEWLRIRETESGASINYKNWHNEQDKTTVICDEYETKVDNPGQVKKIFAGLDFREVIVVEKFRSTWLYKDTEIAIDRVTDLGDFIEIEYAGNLKKAEDAEAHIYSIIDETGIITGEQDFRGYPYLAMEKKGLISTLSK